LGDRISDVFEARLRRTKPDAMVRVVVMLRRDRAAVREVDAVLARVGGRRVSKRPNVLGYVTVDTTPAGVRALASCEAVRGVIEDQPVRLAM
jgi:hypothetical protein